MDRSSSAETHVLRLQHAGCVRRAMAGAIIFGVIITPCLRPSLAMAAPTAQEVLASLPFSDGEKQQILQGDLVTAAAKESSERELAVAMAFLVKQPPADVVGLFRAAGGLKTDPMISGHGQIKGEGSADDFKGLVLKPEGEKAARRYLDAKPGADLNLDTGEIAAFAALRAQNLSGAAAVERVEEQLRSLLLARYKAYRAGGLSAIAPYDRGGSKRQAGEELAQATEASKLMAQYAPAFHRVLLKYPQDKPAQFEEGFFWINFNIDDQPTVALTHRMSLPLGDGYIIADRHYYVSRSHNTVQAIAGVLPVSEGAVVFYANRTSTDQVGGFGSSAKRGIGTRIMAKQISETFEKLRKRGAGK